MHLQRAHRPVREALIHLLLNTLPGQFREALLFQPDQLVLLLEGELGATSTVGRSGG